jgi:hypothetical protein
VNESSVFRSLKDKLCRPEDRFERVENGMVDGMPDVNYCLAKREGWIEIKAPKTPKLGASRLLGASEEFKVAQANWFLRQTRAGGRCALFIATEGALLAVPGNVAAREGIKLNAYSLDELRMYSEWSVDLPAKDVQCWWDLREFLTKP